MKWSDPEGAFEGWKECSRGRPCDYTGMTYAKLRGSSGIQWPCNDEHPDGTERLYADGRFFADAGLLRGVRPRHGHRGARLGDRVQGAQPRRARRCSRRPSTSRRTSCPSEEFPFQLITGRTLYHFHTRTKTGRAPQLQAAAPEVWVEMSASDAADRGLAEGDLLEITTPRGRVEARLRISGIRPGVVFLPFHYGYWDTRRRRAADGHGRAANELTLTDWDPVSKQPIFKTAAAAVRRIAAADGAPIARPDHDGVGAGGRIAAADDRGRRGREAEELVEERP